MHSVWRIAPFLISVGVAGFFAAGCGNSDFSSGGKRGASDRTGKDKTDAPSLTEEGPGGKGSGGGDEGPGKDGGKGGDDDGKGGGDDDATHKCLAKWGSHPFGQKPSYRKIHASVQVFGAGRGIVDDVQTDKPELVLITAAVNVLGKTTYELMNPNGWYCLKVDVNVMAGTTIKLHCKAHLADSKVDVSVGSDSRPVGVVGVHVLSDVDVERVGQGGKQCE